MAEKTQAAQLDPLGKDQMNPWKERRVIGDAVLYLGDCWNMTWPDVDVSITDPPYAEKTHAGARTGAGDETLLTFSSIDDDTFLSLCGALITATKRWCVLTCDWRHAAKLEDSELSENLVRLGVWIKPNGAPQFTGDRPATGWEAVAMLHKTYKKRWNGGGHPAVWTHNKENSNHPTGKPLGLLEKWVSLFSDQGELVFDPMMGSGTTGVACMNLGRKFIGIEIEPKYYEIACQRIENAQRQQSLLDPYEQVTQSYEQAKLL